MRPAIADWTASVATAVRHIGCSSRGGPGSTTTVGVPGDDDAGRGAHRVEDDGAGRHQRLLAVGGQHRVDIDAGEPGHQAGDDLGDPGLERGVEHQLPAAEPGHDLDRHVIGGRAETAAGDDEIDALVGEEPQLRLDVGGAVAAQRDVAQIHTQLE